MKSELTLLAYKLIHFNGSYLIVSIVPYKTVKWTILFRTSSSGRRWRPCAGSGRRRAPAPWCPGTRGTRAGAMSAATTLLQLCSQHTHRIARPGAFSRKFVDSSIQYLLIHCYKGASPQGSIHHQMVSESWNFTGRAQMCALRQKCF